LYDLHVLTPIHERKLKILIVAGEASGDAHAARLIKALDGLNTGGPIEFFGAAGPRMRDAGVKAVVNSDEMSIVGVAEIAKALPMFWSAFKALLRAAENEDPDVAVLVDFPDFNLKLAKALKKRGFRVVYYISPQLWAWRKYRVGTIRKYIDLLLTILPFEKAWYNKHGFDRVEFVGNPLANEVVARRSRAAVCADLGLNAEQPLVALLPGSRHNEIARILPVMIESALTVELERPDIQFAVAVRSGKNRIDVDSIVSSATKLPGSLSIAEDSTYDVLAAADAAIVTSGTATLETGIIGTPMVIVYKTSGLNYALLKPLISVEHYGLINLIAGRKVAKELIQGEFSSSATAAEVLRLLDPEVNAKTRAELADAAAKLGSESSSGRAAVAIFKLLEAYEG
jgi:lipid-A-disaccharide synthase